MIETVSVIGLGKLGSPMAACFAAEGFQVIGADSDTAKVTAVADGEAPVLEPGLPELLRENHARVRATTDIVEAVRASQMIFVIVPTPSKPDGEFSLEFVLAACQKIGLALQDRQDFPVVVLTSTVMPGATDGPVRRRLEEVSGRQCGIDFGLCYSPEFIALGSVIHDLQNPDFILIGESDPRSGAALAAVYQRTCHNTPVVARMNAINAELTKIAVNTYVTTKISYANMLSELCQRLPGADVDVVTNALGLDSRIGRKYLKGATGYGGPCFPRDNVAFAALARTQGVPALIAEATDGINKRQVPRLAALVRSLLPDGGRVGVLGLSYKPETDVVTESQGVQVAALLAAQGVSVTVFDPAAMDHAHGALGERVIYAQTAAECVAAADVVVVTTPWPEFARLSPQAFLRSGEPCVLIDCWRQFQGQMDHVVHYVAPGIGHIR